MPKFKSALAEWFKREDGTRNPIVVLVCTTAAFQLEAPVVRLW
jgi:hypothetical protein